MVPSCWRWHHEDRFPQPVFAAFSDELYGPFSKAAKTFPCRPSLYTVNPNFLSRRWGPLHHLDTYWATSYINVSKLISCDALENALES